MTPRIRSLANQPDRYYVSRMWQAIERILTASTELEKSRANRWALAWARVPTSPRQAFNESLREMRMAIARAARYNRSL